MRKEVVNNAKILRIVDFLGNQNGFKFISCYLYEKIINEKYEYMDFMCFGFDYNILEKSGFIKVNPNKSKIIIPNYFSPLVLENTKINFFADTKNIEKIRMFKADGDQDRPS